MIRLIVLFGLACVGACQQPAPQAQVTEPKSDPVSAPFLTEQEIRGLLDDTPVVLQPAPADGAEEFHPGGLYISESRGAYLQGRYEVSAGQICVMILRNPPHCRSVFRGGGGELRLGARPGSTEQSYEVRLAPTPSN